MIISFEIVKRRYHELSIYDKNLSQYLRYCIGSFLQRLNYSIKLLMERWPHCHVRYCFVSTSFTRTWLRYVRVFAIANPSVVCLSV